MIKEITIAILGIMSIILFRDNISLERKLKDKVYYKSDLTRAEMVNALKPLCGTRYSLFLPGDTSVLPYIIKNK